ncbi:hypothetical protein JCM11957_05130 [Caminibacter profundus]
MIMKQKSVRKTFTLPKNIVFELEEFVRDNHLKQSQVIADALNEYLNRHKIIKKIQKRKKALENIVGIANGKLVDFNYKEILKEKAENE